MRQKYIAQNGRQVDTTYEGTVELNGKAITGPSVDKGFIFQEPRLFPSMVEKNIAADLSLGNVQVQPSSPGAD